MRSVDGGEDLARVFGWQTTRSSPASASAGQEQAASIPDLVGVGVDGHDAAVYRVVASGAQADEVGQVRGAAV